jgi:hypothetical protein
MRSLVRELLFVDRRLALFLVPLDLALLVEIRVLVGDRYDAYGVCDFLGGDSEGVTGNPEERRL